MICTRVDCGNDAVLKERDRDGRIWARLCVQHRAELDDAIAKLAEGVDNEGIPGILAEWIKAQARTPGIWSPTTGPPASIPDATGE